MSEAEILPLHEAQQVDFLIVVEVEALARFVGESDAIRAGHARGDRGVICEIDVAIITIAVARHSRFPGRSQV